MAVDVVMTRSVYLVGGAGVGKSTFMNQLLDDLDCDLGPLTDLFAKANVKNIVTLRGHSAALPGGRHGVYLGCMREQFPGTDGLDRASSPVGEEWLHEMYPPDFIISEGATLATRRFISALHFTTDLLLVHLVCVPAIKNARLEKRGTGQDASFVQATETRMANLCTDMRKIGVEIMTVETSDYDTWDLALDLVAQHVSKLD